jgi:signal transduction histidine kinase
VTNALKFSPPGAPVRLEVQTAADHPRARLAVVDRGPGIALDEQPNLFRKFGRASTRPTGGEASHGLGLAVAKRLAEAMGATVGCDSETGRGATFWIELPRVR